MSKGESGVLSLQLTPVVRVAGEELSGEVHLNFHALQRTPLEEVLVEFHGQLKTYVTPSTCDDPVH